MKKMNNYEAPKAEVIELNVSRDLMQHVGTGDPGAGTTPDTSF